MLVAKLDSKLAGEGIVYAKGLSASFSLLFFLDFSYFRIFGAGMKQVKRIQAGVFSIEAGSCVCGWGRGVLAALVS